MTTEQALSDLMDALEAAKRLAAEKRKHYRASRLSFISRSDYQAHFVAAVAYASAADSVEELSDQHEEAVAEWQQQVLEEERAKQPPLRLDAENDLPLDVVMAARASEGDDDAMRWIQGNLK